jgi:3-oxoacyl-[acyl-carrier protein] reductase
MTSGTRTALITGSGQNIGRAIALHLARRGFNVVLNGSRNRAACDNVAGECRALGAETLVAMGDVGDQESADAIAEAAIEAFGTVDVLINNAAVRPDTPFLDVSQEDWDHVMNVNLGGAVWLSRACLPGMIEKGWGRIVNFSGMNAHQGYPGKAAVTVSKYACWGLTKSLSKEFGRHGVTVNIISPGTIVGEEKSFSDATYAALLEDNPAGRLGVPDDIASAVDLLVSDEGGFINGQFLQINGGVVN